MDPLVSVLMPCYNAAATLPLALASLKVQTYTNWECVLVDDGSGDRPEEIVEQFGDPRIRFIRHSRNLGRPAARQKSVDSAKGTLLTMLDADDWIYPEKLKVQVETLTSEPSLALVSTSMGIVNRQGQLSGIRGPQTATRLATGQHAPGSPAPCAFAPSMYRKELGVGIVFDNRYPFAEDADYLSRILANRRYGVLKEVQYIYTEYSSVTLSKVLLATKDVAGIYLNSRRHFPIKSRWLALKNYARAPLYRAADRLGMWDMLIQRRSRRPTAAELMQFKAAEAVVAREIELHFGHNAVGAITPQAHHIPL